LAATVLSVLSILYLFLEPRFSFVVAHPTDLVGLGLFAVIGIAISLLEAPGSFSGRLGADRLERTGADPVGTPLLRRVATVAAAAVALGILASLLWNGLQRSTNAERWIEHTYQVLNAASSVRSYLERAQTSQRGYLLTGSDQYLEAYQSAIASERQVRATLRLLTADNPVEQARLDEFDQLLRTRLDMLAGAIELRRQQGTAAVADLVRANRGKERGDQLRAILDAVDNEERRLLHSRAMAASAADSRTRWILGLGSGSLVLLLILAGGAIERHIHERNQAEVVLARQSRLIDLSHDAIITADGNRVITGWNSGAQEMYGWAEKEAVGQTMHELLHTSSSTPIAEVDRILAREGRWHGELAHTRSDGRQIAVESRQVLQRDDAGRPAGYLEINRDITERKQAEEALRESESEQRRQREFLASLLASAPYGISVCKGRDLVFEMVNPAYQAMVGPEVQFVGRPYREAFPQAAAAGAEARLQQVIETGEPWIVERFGAPIPGKPNAIWDGQVVRLPSAAGDEPSILAIVWDVTEQAATEEALRLAHEKLAGILESLGDGFVACDREWRYTYVNAAAERLQGRKREELLGQDMRVLYPDATAFLARYERAIAEQVSLTFEDYYPPLKMWTEVSVHPSADGMSQFFRDVTQRKRTEDALRESEARFRNLFESMDEGFTECEIIYDAAGRPIDYRYLAVNPAFGKVSGRSVEQMQGRTVSEAIPGIEPFWIETYGRIVRTGKSERFANTVAALGKHFEVYAWRSGPGRFAAVFGDVTERKRSEEALRESRAKLEAALASMTEAVFISDTEGRFIHLNGAVATFYRFPSKDECAKTLAEYPAVIDVFLPDGTPAPLEMWAVPRALRGEVATNAEYTLRRKNTGETWIGSYSFSPIRDPDGRIAGAVVVARDITDRKRAEEEIRLLNTELEQRVRDRTAQLEASNKELEAFAYSVSHDLRAPLRGIDGWTLAVIEDYCSQCEKYKGKGREYLDRVRSETQRMGHLIDDLLQLSRITRAHMHRDAVDLSLIAESVAARLRETNPQRDLEFAIWPALTAFGDARLLGVALTNLLENAVKFTGTRAHARIEFETANYQGQTAFVVRDNGVGFDMAYASTLFGAFQRLHSDSEFPGTGIGLATVQRVIHRHGGRVWAEAEPDRGASFYFTLGSEK
jgi:PAS domain S-box-containing protein